MDNNYIAEDKDFKLYTLAELKYESVFKQVPQSDKYPNNWYSSSDYKLKTKIIAEAIANNVLIKDTETYNTNFVEDIKYK